MCGIAFTYRPLASTDEMNCAMELACKAMAQRGPDMAGRKVCPPWSMGHQRLSIIDPQSPAQPIADPSGRFYLSYNGELYNYRDLREGLKDRWHFTTTGDAEVVLAGLINYGTEFLHRMEGMWALALWDNSEKNLLLVRDRLGKKPLYYCCDQTAFACASELQSLQMISGTNWQEDEHSTADYFRYGFYLPGATAYKEVCEVLPAHWLKWSPGKRPLLKPYWQLSPKGFQGSRKSAAKMLRTAFFESVRLRMVADVEVGALLSGGIDSSLIVCAMTRQRRRPVQTFTIGFHEAPFDERRYARTMAGYCQSDHHEQLLTWDRCAGLAAHLLKHVGQPFGDASLLPAAMVSRMASQRLKVVLTGDGGDELFGGYNRYLARSLLRWLTRLPRPVRNLRRDGIKRLFKLGTGNPVLKYIIRMSDILQRMEDENPYVAPLSYDRDALQQLIPDLWRRGHPAPNMPQETRIDDIRQMMVSDALVYLPQDILAKMDRAGMAFSLEVRSPFLDRRVVELAYSLPRSWHRRGARGKRMLRAAFGEMVPQWIWKRPKRGFALPLERWFKTGLQNRLMELLMETPHPLNGAFVEKMVDAHVAGQCNHGVRLWQIYIYLQWLAFRPYPFQAIGRLQRP
ncbi:MAG: asparagine synthase (glutamine-hydrolyzing) [Desulfobacteraceae bacterium]